MYSKDFYVLQYWSANPDDPFYGDILERVFVNLTAAKESAQKLIDPKHNVYHKYISDVQLYKGKIVDGRICPGYLLETIKE